METMVQRVARTSHAGYKRQRARTVRGVRFQQVGYAGGCWKTEDGYAAEVYEGDYGGWSLYLPSGETMEVGSLDGAAREIARQWSHHQWLGL